MTTGEIGKGTKSKVKINKDFLAIGKWPQVNVKINKEFL